MQLISKWLLTSVGTAFTMYVLWNKLYECSLIVVMWQLIDERRVMKEEWWKKSDERRLMEEEWLNWNDKNRMKRVDWSY